MLSENLINRIGKSAYAAVTAWDDDEAPRWSEVDQQTRDAVLNRVRVTLGDPRSGDATYHNGHIVKMKELGWSEGREFSETEKTDPLLVPYHRLPPEFQARERCFRAVTLSLSRI